MSDFYCDRNAIPGINRTGPPVLETPTAPNHSLIERGSRMADYSPYSNRDCGDKPEQSANCSMPADEVGA